MAPDLNSVPPSPRPRGPSASSATATSPSLSRRVSQTMGPPPLPHHPSSPGLAGSMQPIVGDNTGVGSGPGPLRHPRPLTVADLHLELEKEQEAVVNRLTRELSLLRQQTASVASTASSTSTGLNDNPEQHHQSRSGSTQPPTPSRHRSSSSISARSLVGASTGPLAGSVNSIAPSREGRPSLDLSRGSFSRDPSVAAHRQSGPNSPSLSASFQHHGEYVPYHSHASSHSHRPSLTSVPASASLSPQPGASTELARSGSLSSTTTTSRYEEAAYHRAELEAVKRENEALRRRVRDLEASLKEFRQQPQVTHEQTGSSIASTNPSRATESSIPAPVPSEDTP